MPEGFGPANFKGAAGTQGNVFMPDAVFCRKCGAKRETA